MSAALALVLVTSFIPAGISFADEDGSDASELEIPPIVLAPEDIEQADGIADIMSIADIDMSESDADSDTADTDMTLQYIEDVTDAPSYDEEEPNVGPGSDDTVKYAVPTKLPMAFKTDGTLICARGNAYKIDNLGRITLQLNDVMAHPKTGYDINPKDESDIADDTLALKLGFTHSNDDDAIVYDAADAIYPKNAADSDYTIGHSIPITTDDLKLAFGGRILNDNVDASAFDDATDIGTLIWTASAHETDNDKAAEYARAYAAAPGGKGFANNVRWFIDDSDELVIAPANGASGYIIDPGKNGSSPWHDSHWTSVRFEPGVAVTVDASDLFAIYTPNNDPFGGNDPFGASAASDPDANSVSPAYVETPGFPPVPEKVVIDLRGLDTSRVTDMSRMFKIKDSTTGELGCGNMYYAQMELIGLETLDTSNVRSMSEMFRGWNEVSITVPSTWNTGELRDISRMFADCHKATEITFPDNFNTSKVTNMSGLFDNCGHLASVGYGTGWSTANVTDTSWMFHRCAHMVDIDLSDWNLSKVEDVSCMFYMEDTYLYDDLQEDALNGVVYGSSLKTVDLSGLRGAPLREMDAMFHWCSKLERIVGLEVLDTSRATKMNGIFYCCQSIGSLEVDDWDVSSATGLKGIFAGCWEIESLDLSKWNTSNVWDMSEMFANCKALSNLKLGTLEIGKVTDMSSFFYKCGALTFDCSSWVVDHYIANSKFSDAASGITPPTWFAG